MTIYLDHKRRDIAGVVSKLQHAVAGFPLFTIALGKLREGHELPLAGLEMAIAVVVLGTFFIEMRALIHKHRNPGHEHKHAAVGWFDIAAAGMLIFEAFHGEHTKPGYLRPPFFSAIITLGMGLFHGKFHHARLKSRYLKMDEAGIECRPSRFRKFSVRWTDLATVKIADNKAVFQRKDGSAHSLGLRGLHNRSAVQKAIEEQARVAGLLPAPAPVTGDGL